MNPTHLHLVITHLPIYGAILGVVVLAFGIMKKSPATYNAAYIVLLISAIGGLIAFFTGEPAEETVENIAGISKNLIEEHEESANFTLVLLIIMGLSSCVGFFISLKNSKLARSMPLVVLIISIVCFGAAARTGYLGGKIRHSEVDASSQQIHNDNR